MNKFTELPMNEQKNIAIVAHDNKKFEILEWAKYNKEKLSKHVIYTTGTTGVILEKELGLEVHKFKSGPLGGDLQIGSKIVDGDIDCLIFFWDPLEPQPHDPDVKALLRIAVVWNIPIASNKSSADFIFSSSLMEEKYQRKIVDYSLHKERKIDLNT